MNRASKIAVVSLLVLVVVVMLVLRGDHEENEEAARAPGCAEGARVTDVDPMEAGVERGERVLLGCVRLRGGARLRVAGYSVNGRSCVDAIDSRTGEGGGCNDELGEGAVEVGGRELRPGRGERITGRTDPRADRVRVRYLTRPGCIGHTRAGYVAIRDRAALRRSANRGPFGFYAVDLPRGATLLTIEAVAGQGRVLGEARAGFSIADGTVPVPASPTCERPYVGYACARPGQTGCDRVGVSASVSLYVERVRATIAGRRIELRRSRKRGRDGRGIFEGFLEPARLRVAKTMPLRLDVKYVDGRRATRMFRARVNAGYG